MPQRTLLGRVLLDNAVISGLTGLILMVGAGRLDGWLGANAWILAGIGVGLVFYALDLVAWARSPKWLRRGGLLAVTGDTLWVIGSVALITFTSVLTPAGEVALGVVTAVVAVFVVLQAIGLTKLEEEAWNHGRVQHRNRTDR
jgi:uncharacterized membrane protein